MELVWDGKQVKSDEASAVTALIRGCYGENKKGVVHLGAEEALYLMDVRGATCTDASGNRMGFNELAGKFSKKKKLLARYLTYKDWRDRGLFIRKEEEATGEYGRSVSRKYARGEGKLELPEISGAFFKDDLLCVVDGADAGSVLYNEYWIGQMGTYKASHRGSICKLDIFEALLLSEMGKLEGCSKKEMLSAAKERIGYFGDIYSVYREWREAGYVVKTGFKFGTHFRIYFPGAKPGGGKDWVHSKHVLHVFPKQSSLLISEWARAIRVAHSVKKTFILAIPGEGKKKKGEVDFALYYRKGMGVETPKEGKPAFLMLSLSEDEYLSGEELAASLGVCSRRGLDLLVAIADRETAVTYYLIKRIELPKSKYEYYEIEWMQP
ncbi:tRNA-intron lyase [Candidatus Micrarchaeota archaeon]|nr:tRNA-intron lyase [Candidatus Micrarchaeota archaeon]